MGIGMGNGNRVVGKMGMEIRYWTGNGNGMGMGTISYKWEGMGTAIVIPASFYCRHYTVKAGAY